MKRRDFLNSSLLAAAVTVPGIRAAYAVVGTDQVADLAAVTGDGREITLRGTDIRDLAAKMRGQLLLAADEGYDKARLVRNPSFDKHPALIAQPSGAADVQAVVSFARANGRTGPPITLSNGTVTRTEGLFSGDDQTPETNEPSPENSADGGNPVTRPFRQVGDDVKRGFNKVSRSFVDFFKDK
jgi:hypothetical protein